MARTTSRPTPTAPRTRQPLGRHCPLCGETMWAAYHNYRTITTLEDVVPLTLHIRRCLRERYDELLPLSRTATARLQRIPQAQGRVILALDGLQPDVGHEVLWVLRDCLSGEVLLARSVLSATPPDLAVLLRTVRQNVPGPLVGIVSDGPLSLRGAVAEVFSDVPHHLCHFHLSLSRFLSGMMRL
jgi:hypothetical protein